jgi:hypothetical protein
MATSAIIGNDNGDIEFFRVCSVCSKKLYPGDHRYKVADIVICFNCYCGSDFEKR